MKQISILILLLLIGFTGVGSVYAKSREVYLLPSEPGKPGKIVPINSKASVYWLIEYYRWRNFCLSGLLAGDTVGIYFEPPAACSLAEVHFCRYRWTTGPTEYYAMVARAAHDMSIYEEYHSSESMPGPSPIDTIYADTVMEIEVMGEWDWDTLVVSTTPDVGTDAFIGACAIEDSSHSIAIEGGVNPPYHAICWKQRGAAPTTNGPGWYASWHLFWIRALVKVYENIGPIIEVEELLGTYNTGDRKVEIYTEDFDPDIATLGIDDIHLYYILDDRSDTLVVDIVQDSMYNPSPGWEYAWWHVTIPGQLAGTKVTYWVEGFDGAGAAATTPEHWYKVKGGIPGNGLLYVEDDEVWGDNFGIHDAFAGLPWDLWYELDDGVADNTVTDFYITGGGANTISWLTFSGFNFVDWICRGYTSTGAFREFMDNGGCLFLAGQDIPGGGYCLGYEDWVSFPMQPLYDYLKAYEGYDDYITVSPFTVTVDTTDVLTIGMPHELTVDCGLLGYSTWVGIYTELDSLCVPLFFDEEENILGYRYEDPAKGFKIVFLYFPFHAITDTNAQDTFISNITNWFGGVEESTEPTVCQLPVVSPNPLSGSTTINFTIPKNEYVSVKVYDVMGSVVSKLVNERLTAGTHSLTINTESFTSGVYFLKMDAGTFSGTRKFLVLK